MKRSVKMLVLPFFLCNFYAQGMKLATIFFHFQKNIKGTLKIHDLPNSRSGDNRRTNFAPVYNATFQYVLQLAECSGK